MNANTFELDQFLWFDDEYEQPSNIGSFNDHEIIEDKPKLVASSCKQIELQYTPAKIVPDENFVEDEPVIELTPSPEDSPSSSKESLIQFPSFFCKMNLLKKLGKAQYSAAESCYGDDPTSWSD